MAERDLFAVYVTVIYTWSSSPDGLLLSSTSLQLFFHLVTLLILLYTIIGQLVVQVGARSRRLLIIDYQTKW